MTIRTYDDSTHVAVPKQVDNKMIEAAWDACDWSDIANQEQLAAAIQGALAASPQPQPVEQEPFGYALVNTEDEEAVMFYSPDMKPNATKFKDKFELINVYTIPPDQSAKIAELEAANDTFQNCLVGLHTEVDKLAERLRIASDELEFQRNGHNQSQELLLEQGKQLAAQAEVINVVKEALKICVVQGFGTDCEFYAKEALAKINELEK